MKRLKNNIFAILLAAAILLAPSNSYSQSATSAVKTEPSAIKAVSTFDNAASSNEINDLVSFIKKENVIEEDTLSNGIKIVFKKNMHSDLVVYCLLLKAGSAFEPVEKNGISCLLVKLIKKGNAKMNAVKISDNIEKTGAVLSSEAKRNRVVFSLLSTLDSFEKNFDIYSECIISPSFTKEEVDKEKKFLAASLKIENDEIGIVCSKLFYKTIFAGHPYEKPSRGSLETIPNIKRDDILKWYKTIFIPENMTFVVVGNTDMKTVKAVIEKRFGNMAKNTKQSKIFEDATKKIAIPIASAISPREVREFKDKAAQCFICMGFITEGVESKDYGALMMLNTILGSGMSSRLFSILRNKESLAYQINSSFQALSGNSALIMVMRCQESKYEKAIKGLKREIDRFRTEPVTQEEYNRARNKLVGTYAINRDTLIEQAIALINWESLGLGAKFENQYLEKVLAPDRQELQKVAQKYFDPAKYTLAVIRPPKKVNKSSDAKTEIKKEGVNKKNENN